MLKCKHSVSRLYCHSDIWCRESKYAKAHSANGRLHDDQIRQQALCQFDHRIENKISPLVKGIWKKKYKGINISTWRKLSIYLFCLQPLVEQVFWNTSWRKSLKSWLQRSFWTWVPDLFLIETILCKVCVKCMLPHFMSQIYFVIWNKHRRWQMASHKDSIRAICLPNGSSNYQPVIWFLYFLCLFQNLKE